MPEFLKISRFMRFSSILTLILSCRTPSSGPRMSTAALPGCSQLEVVCFAWILHEWPLLPLNATLHVVSTALPSCCCSSSSSMISHSFPPSFEPSWLGWFRANLQKNERCRSRWTSELRAATGQAASASLQRQRLAVRAHPSSTTSSAAYRAGHS